MAFEEAQRVLSEDPPRIETNTDSARYVRGVDGSVGCCPRADKGGHGAAPRLSAELSGGAPLPDSGEQVRRGRVAALEETSHPAMPQEKVEVARSAA